TPAKSCRTPEIQARTPTRTTPPAGLVRIVPSASPAPRPVVEGYSPAARRRGGTSSAVGEQLQADDAEGECGLRAECDEALPPRQPDLAHGRPAVDDERHDERDDRGPERGLDGHDAEDREQQQQEGDG